MKTKFFYIVLGSALALATTACKGIADDCFDTIDNDKDGLVDFADPGCNGATQLDASSCAQTDGGTGLASNGNPGCNTSGRFSEKNDPQCNDRKDNDKDGLVDRDDPGCLNVNGNVNVADDDEGNPECSDGKDNDGDGLVDWPQDPACTNKGFNAEAADPVCANLRDDDGDGLVDARDPGCWWFGNREINPACSNGIDDDGDGKKDFPNDPDCTTMLQDWETAAQCGDGIDNDFDGAKDFPNDPGCTSRVDNSELNGACQDGADNDGDGFVDMNDPGCVNPVDSSEGNNGACNDRFDNDADGFTDFPDDPGCVSAEDGSESETTCANRVDDDGDGKVDFPEDPDCASPGGNEGNTNACADAIDNDGDGKIDWPADLGCTSEADGTEQDVNVGECNDGIDNDQDGGTDVNNGANNFPDAACVAGYVFEDLDPTCADQIDNDGDGKADFQGVDLNHDGLYDGPGEFAPDPGCSSNADFSEGPNPRCSDGLDNDGDGSVDWNGIDLNGDGLFTGAGEMPPDFACVTGTSSELAMQRRDNEMSVFQCDDNFDNDGDGLVDYEPEFLNNGPPPTLNPNFLLGDPECINIFDNTEGSL